MQPREIRAGVTSKAGISWCSFDPEDSGDIGRVAKPKTSGAAPRDSNLSSRVSREVLVYKVLGIRLGHPRRLLWLLCEVEHPSEAADEKRVLNLTLAFCCRLLYSRLPHA